MDVTELLRSPEGQRVYMAATKAAHDVNAYRWYDSGFLKDYAAARMFLRLIMPEQHDRFVAAFDPLRTRPDFQVRTLTDVLDQGRMARLREVVASLGFVDLASSSGSRNEKRNFGRFLYRDHPYFDTLQRELTPVVSEMVGEEVTPTYNFLSLYTDMGMCPPHMDDMMAKYTLDMCIDQNVRWPIHFSRVVDWPDVPGEAWEADQIVNDESLRFESFTLEPNRAVLFSGSAQWHYRNPMPKGATGQFCNLLFLHFTATAGAALADSRNWARYFDIAELDLVRSLIPRSNGATLTHAR